jgi:hypothetical protein
MWTMLAWIVTGTSRIGVTMRDLGPPYRSAAVLATMAETFDRPCGSAWRTNRRWPRRRTGRGQRPTGGRHRTDPYVRRQGLRQLNLIVAGGDQPEPTRRIAAEMIPAVRSAVGP